MVSVIYTTHRLETKRLFLFRVRAPAAKDYLLVSRLLLSVVLAAADALEHPAGKTSDVTFQFEREQARLQRSGVQTSAG
jgi:hypothetical protein